MNYSKKHPNQILNNNNKKALRKKLLYLNKQKGTAFIGKYQQKTISLRLIVR
jgi:hypothetical protein